MGERLADTVTLVTGSGSGIGTAARRCFAAEGARVLVADLNEASARDGCGNQEVRLGLQIRRTLRGSVASAVEVPVASCGMLDIVCNTAGIGPGGTIEDTSLAH